VIVCGPPCTGKSTIAEALQQQTGNFIHLEMDRIREWVIPDSDQRLEHRDIGYRTMHLIARHLLLAGQNLIVNATYNRAIHRAELAQTIGATGSSAFLVQCRAPLDLALARFRNRPPGHPALDLDEKKVRDLHTRFAYSVDGILLDTSHPQDVCLDRLETYIRGGSPSALERWLKMR
jgi:predicted kinase